LTLQIVFWKIESPSELQLPKWEPIWECVGSFLHILLHSWECECDSQVHFWHAFLHVTCFGREPKARVSCEYILSYNIHRWHTILTYTHKHITWTRAYANTCVPQLKMSREKSTIIKFVMQTHTVKPSPLHPENLGRC
jgi:hypothetical protein